MSTIVTRAGKGSALTYAEVDSNFTNLNTDKYQSGSTASLASLTLASALPVLSGGTGTTTSTGSGSVVFSTSPTLVTPLLGTPTSGNFSTGTFTWPTFNQNTTGTAAKWTTARTLAGNSVDGSANVAFANKFIVQGTTDTGLSGAQFLGALGTGIVKNTTTTGVLSIAVAADFPTLNQNTTGTAAGLSATLVATSGGTGQSSYAVGDLLYASTTTALSKLADVATGNALISGGVGVAPAWGKIGLTTHVSGTLPVANGGTGITSLGAGVATWLGTPSSANLLAAMTDETGTGSLVFGTSPTLITPTLGAASATSVAFGLGAAATPSITFTGDLNTGFWSPAADTLAASTAGLERLRIAASGHVGISAIPSAWVSSVRAIQIGVGGSVSTWDGSNGSVTLGANLYDAGGAVIKYINSAAAGAFDIVAGAFSWRTAPAGIAGNPITLTQAMTLTSAGSLGIGTASPASKLEVSGGNIWNTNTATPGIALRVTDVSSNGANLTSDSSGNILFTTRVTAVNTERMRITGAGNVGIGTSAPDYKLKIEQGLSNNNNGLFISNTNYGSMQGLNISMVNAGVFNFGSYAVIKGYKSGVSVITNISLQPDEGSVGIGTTTNLSTLTVNGSFASKSPSTVNAATYTVAATDGSLRFTTTNCTVTLPAAASFPGRILYLNTITANSVISASSNVIPLGSNTAGTAILAATLGKFAMIQSDGTNWITMMAN